VIVEVTSGLNTAVQIPSDSVSESRFNTDYTNWANPYLALLCASTIGLLNLILNTTL
jgi:hypothetical protein